MSVLHALKNSPLPGPPPTIICYEKQSEIGGLWNVTWRTGTDEFGLPVHSSQYRNLWSNGPKECLEYEDYTFEQHFGKPIPSFPPRIILKDYFCGRAKNDHAEQHCKFNTFVQYVTYNTCSSCFIVTSKNLITGLFSEDEFDYVVVANGHYSLPNVPTFPGIETFNGRILHSHDYRNASEFKNQHVLVVGGSYSAEDISLQLIKYDAASVTISYRTRGFGFKWPKNIDERPLITHIEDNTVHFKDGTKKNFDSIVLCTGYLNQYDFLDNSLALKTKNVLYPALYKGVVWMENTKLFYIGAQDQFYTFPMFDLQAQFVRDIIIGKLKVPSISEMKDDVALWIEQDKNAIDYDAKIDFQTKYMKNLCEEMKCEFNVDASEMFKEWERNKSENIVTYRDRVFTSMHTKNLSPKLQIPWWEAFDDSYKGFFENF